MRRPAVAPLVAPLEVVFLVGLAGVFLVNAIVAVWHPSDFTELASRSAVCRWLGVDAAPWLAPAIAANDVCLGLALLATIPLARARTLVLAWSGVWLLAVTVIKLTALGS